MTRMHKVMTLIAACLALGCPTARPARAAACAIDGVSVPCKSIDGVQPVFRADIMSTSTDWEALTGLRLSEYKMTFEGTKAAAGAGWEIYYLDAFPCYGYAQYVRTWTDAKTKDASVRANCVRRPTEISLAYRVAKKSDPQGRTTGMLKCRVEKNLTVDLTKCEKQNWSEFAKD
jgi:hypothetical protein